MTFVGSSGLEPLPLGPILQTGCRIRTTFATQLSKLFHTELLGTIRASRTRCTTQIGYNMLSATWLSPT